MEQAGCTVCEAALPDYRHIPGEPGHHRFFPQVPHPECQNNGVTLEEMADTLTQVAFYAGWPKAWAAFRLVKEVYGVQ